MPAERHWSSPTLKTTTLCAPLEVRKLDHHHEYANIFPMLEPDETRKLTDSIKANGQENVIVVHQGAILDRAQSLGRRPAGWRGALVFREPVFSKQDPSLDEAG